MADFYALIVIQYYKVDLREFCILAEIVLEQI